jgi:two-component system, OmpR family, sensor histidine kinase BaeS
VADISHELRTPLAVLRGEIEALVDGVRPLHHQAMLSLQEEVLRIGALVDDLHLLAMSDLQTLPCQFSTLDAAAFVQHLLQRFDSRATVAGLTLSANLVDASALSVTWDGTRITQLLSNLLDNSLRYTDAPGRIVLLMQRKGEHMLIDIDDSAPGVPGVDLPRLFEPLYRADAARHRHRGGSGLGLAICEAIVRSHGGQITASASTLGGLRVHIQLPLLAGSTS